VENVRILAGELAASSTMSTGQSRSTRVALMERLKAADWNLEAAAGELAGNLGLVAVS
jgi:hypothetical protein